MVSEEFKKLQSTIPAEIEAFKLKDDATKRLEKADIPKVKKPSKDIYLEFPDDVSELDDKELGKYIGIYESSASWIEYCIARREIDLSHAEVLMSYVNAKLSEKHNTLKPTDKKLAIEADNFYLECKLDLEKIKADITLLKTSLSAQQGYARSISREISNRGRFRETFISGRSDKVFTGE